ncbi:MAG: hypothetical protein IMF09_10165 [Proteobacteria bacterium]|nr:hypothetical protein [Pseudomonadota bacterium]
MRGNTLEGLLNIPEQSKPMSGSFDTKPRQVEAWVAALPMANTGESARRLFNALKEVNRLDISAHDRFKVMEIFRTPVFHITGVLKKHYVSQNLPLSPKNQKIAELAIQLYSEMALGYKSVIENKIDSSFSKLSSKTLTYSIHRTIQYLSNVLLCSYQIYIQHPEHIWLQIHRLYLFAEENHLQNTLVKNNIETEPPGERDISDIYKQTLLLALAGPYRLRQQVTEAVYITLESLTSACRILPLSEAQETGFGFIINLNSDAAPGYFRDDGTANPAFHRVIDTSELTNLLEQPLPIAENNPIKIPENVRKQLRQTWSGNSHRAFSRTTKSNETAITLGLSATHHYIDEVVRPLLKDDIQPCPTATESIQPENPQSETTEDAVIDESANFTSTPVFGISNLDDHTPDVWDPDITYRANNPTFSLSTTDAENIQKKAGLYSPLPCKGINESAAGYCLLGSLTYGKDSQKVQVGELVGIRDSIDPDSTQLSIGVIRRIKNWNNGLELGIQKLAPCADAIATTAVPKDDQPETFQRSLVLPDLPGINQQATLITHAWHRIGDELIANVHGQFSRIKLTKQLESTGVFNQFEFSMVDNTETKPKKKSGFITSEDEFDAVWKLI